MPDEIARLSDAMARDPGSMAWVALADALRRARQLPAAEHTALRGLARHPYHADGHDALARIAADAGDLGRARDEWEMTLRLDARHLGALLGMGWLALAGGDRASATRWWEQAHALAPTDARVVAAGRQFAAPQAAPAQPESPDLPAAPRRSPAPRGHDLFASLEAEGAQFALLVDDAGFVIAGRGPVADDATRTEALSEALGAELSGLSADVERARQQLQLGAWERLLVECDAGTMALAPASSDSITLVATPAGTPAGLPRLLVDRARRRATGWLEAL